MEDSGSIRFIRFLREKLKRDDLTEEKENIVMELLLEEEVKRRVVSGEEVTPTTEHLHESNSGISESCDMFNKTTRGPASTEGYCCIGTGASDCNISSPRRYTFPTPSRPRPIVKNKPSQSRFFTRSESNTDSYFGSSSPVSLFNRRNYYPDDESIEFPMEHGDYDDSSVSVCSNDIVNDWIDPVHDCN